MPYTEGFKARMIERMAGPEGISATALAKEVGVSQAALSRWLRLRAMRRVTSMKDENQGREAKKWTAERKLHILLEASRLPDEELGAFLRREGLHEAQLREWIGAATAALSPQPKRKSGKASREAKRIRELEKDLRLKEKALAEVTALLVLKKNWWRFGGTRTTTRARGARHDPGTDRRGCPCRRPPAQGVR